MEVSTTHPASLAEVSQPTVVHSPAFQLKDDLAVLVRERKVSKRFENDEHYQALRDAFIQSSSVVLDSANSPHMVSNAPIPSEWIIDYKLRAQRRGLRSHNFVGLVHFGLGHFTPDHFEMCAAATYGYLLVGEKRWEFKAKDGVSFTFLQRAGDTVFVPAGWVHNVTTQSNGAIIIGESAMTKESPVAFARNAAMLVTAKTDHRHNPEPEAALLCAQFSIPISAAEIKRGGHGYSGPATTTLRRLAAQEAGGTAHMDRIGRRKRKKTLSSHNPRRGRQRTENDADDGPSLS